MKELSIFEIWNWFEVYNPSGVAAPSPDWRWHQRVLRQVCGHHYGPPQLCVRCHQQRGANTETRSACLFVFYSAHMPTEEVQYITIVILIIGLSSKVTCRISHSSTFLQKNHTPSIFGYTTKSAIIATDHISGFYSDMQFMYHDNCIEGQLLAVITLAS